MIFASFNKFFLSKILGSVHFSQLGLPETHTFIDSKTYREIPHSHLVPGQHSIGSQFVLWVCLRIPDGETIRMQTFKYIYGCQCHLDASYNHGLDSHICFYTANGSKSGGWRRKWVKLPLACYLRPCFFTLISLRLGNMENHIYCKLYLFELDWLSAKMLHFVFWHCRCQFHIKRRWCSILSGRIIEFLLIRANEISIRL